MDFSKYISFFHDGTLNEVRFQNDSAFFLLESSEVIRAGNTEDILLNSDNLMIGNLIVIGIKSLQVNGKAASAKFAEQHRGEELMHVKIKGNTAILETMASEEDPVRGWREYFTIAATGEKIIWEDFCNQIQIDLTGQYL